MTLKFGGMNRAIILPTIRISSAAKDNLLVSDPKVDLRVSIAEWLKSEKNGSNDEMSGDEWLDQYGGEWLDGSGFENEPDDAPECSDDYSKEA